MHNEDKLKDMGLATYASNNFPSSVEVYKSLTAEGSLQLFPSSL